MNNRKPLKIALLTTVCVLLVGFTSVAVRDARLGQSIEILLGMFRDLSLTYVDEVDSEKLLRDAAKGMASGLDPYTELITGDRMGDLELMTTGKYGGIGSLIAADSDYVRIAEPYRGSPADRAGLKIGDKIVAVDGKELRGATTQQVSNMLKGDPGTTVRLTIRRLATGKNETMAIRRERISIPAIAYSGIIGDSLGYIHHVDFTDGCSDQMRKVVVELMNQGVKGLVLDYRNNGGGIVQEAVKIISLFVPAGTEVVSMRGRDKSANKVFRTESDPIAPELPIVVLVDGYTASSAEILAGAIQDLDRGVIVGQRTFGKGLVQSTRPLGYDSYLKLTTSKYYTPSGRCIQSFDYSERGHNGGGHIPDSLISEFATAAGRKVYDGGGITPDVELTPEYVNKFAMMMYATGLVDKYADGYSLEHDLSTLDVERFALTDDDYRRFVEMVGDRPLDYESETRSVIKMLGEIARTEGYESEIKSEIEALERKIKSDNASLLMRHREQISRLLEEAIVLRAAYAEGVARYALRSDSAAKRAIQILDSAQEYESILSPRN